MKVFIALCIVGAAIFSVQGELTAEAYKEMRDACVEKTGVTMKMIQDARINEIYPDDVNMEKYMHCIMEKAGAIDADGTIHGNMMMVQMRSYNIAEDEAKTVIDECIAKHKDMENLDKKAYEMYKCFRRGAGVPTQ